MIISALTLSLASGAAAQTTLYTLCNPGDGDADFGTSVDGGHDVNGDGRPDILVGAPDGLVGGAATGRVLVHLGDNTSRWWIREGENGGDKFGWAVSFVPDTDGDGLADVLVGARGHDVNGSSSGRVYLYSGGSGALLATLDGPHTHARLGYSLAGLEDLDGDGYGDVLIGMPDTGSDPGEAHVYSGAGLAAGLGGGALLAVVHPIEETGECCMDFGWSVGSAGDVNADGVPDYVIGAPTDENPGVTAPRCGAAYVFSGASHALLGIAYGDQTGNRFGESVGGVEDVDGDGYDDVIVGAIRCEAGDNDVPYVRVLSGAHLSLTGSVVHYTLEEPGIGICSRFGKSVAGLGDVDGDGRGDLVVGAPYDDTLGTNAGSAWLYSGGTGSRLFGLPGAGGFFGHSIASAGDVNGDGVPDFVVGAPDGPFGGQVRVVSPVRLPWRRAVLPGGC